VNRRHCRAVAWAAGVWAIAGMAVAADATIELTALVSRDAFGGGASDLAVAADGSGRLWVTTDRGPNGTTTVGEKKLRTLLDPGFVPHLVELELRPETAAGGGPAVAVARRIPLAGRTGTPLSGRPNGVGRDEPIVAAASGSPVAGDPNGVDTEGIVHMADGTFWMVEEYRPSLLHVSAEGRVLGRFVPRATRLAEADAEVHAVLPEAYAARRDNRGFESIAASPDGSRLWIMLQSPLDNGSEKRIKKAGNVRLLAFDPVAGRPLAEHVYRVGDPTEPEYLTSGAAPDDAKICALAAIDADTLLVIESDDGGQAALYRVDLAGATDTLARPADRDGRTLDEARDLPAAGIVPVAKTLVADLAPLVPAMRRDVYGEAGAKSDAPLKLEGMAILGPDRVALVNDNDFGVHVKPGARCDTCLWVVRLPHPLRPHR
jgi:hypothetical protein